MTYITDREFEQAFGDEELGDLTGDGAEFAKAAATASSTIDGYIGTRYTLPLLTVPDLVKGWALDITRYRLWDERAPEEVRRRYEDALQQLRDLAAGKLALPPGVDGAPSTGGFESEGYADERIFTAATLADY